jgi:hypothetical protein
VIYEQRGRDEDAGKQQAYKESVTDGTAKRSALAVASRLQQAFVNNKLLSSNNRGLS